MSRLLVAVGMVLFIGVRLHVLDDDIPNPDIAGILYNADILLDGGLPYVETVEVKPPGSFFMAALSFAVLGRDLLALQLVHVLWLLSAAPAVWIVASQLADRYDAPVRSATGALAVAVYLTHAPMFAYNYSSWMMPAYAWAVAAAVASVHRRGAPWGVVAGCAAVVAVVTIQRAAVLAVVMPAVWVWARRRGDAGARVSVVAWWAAGAIATALLLSLPYLVAGEVGALWRGIVPLDVAARYTSRADGAGLGVVVRASGQLIAVFWFSVALTAAGIASSVLARRGSDAEPASGTWLVGGLWLAASIGGAAIGGARFYRHYLVQYVPAMAILAAHPALVGRLLGLRGRVRSHWVARAAVGLTFAAQLIEVAGGSGHRYGAMARRLQTGKTASQAAGEHIRSKTREGDTIAAWGWTAWRVYYWADRRAPGPIYKPMGTLTTFNSNTAFSAGDGIELAPGPHTEAYIRDFDANPPAFFVYSSSFATTFGARPDPLQQFAPLLRRIEQDYVPVAAYGDLQLFRRRPDR